MASLNELIQFIPTHCPACGEKLTLSDDLMHLFCTNTSCSGSLYRRMENMCKAFGIDLIGLKTAQQLVEKNKMQSMVDLFKLTPEDFMVGTYKLDMANKIFNEVHKKRSLKLEDFIKGVQISRIGTGTAIEIAKAFKSLDNFMKASPEDLAQKLPRVTVTLTKQMVESRDFYKNEIDYLASIFDVEEVVIDQSEKLVNINVVITGKVSMPRPQFIAKYSKLGVNFQSSVSKNTNYVISDEDSNSSKMLKAKQLGIKRLSEAEFLSLINQ